MFLNNKFEFYIKKEKDKTLVISFTIFKDFKEKKIYCSFKSNMKYDLGDIWILKEKPESEEINFEYSIEDSYPNCPDDSCKESKSSDINSLLVNNYSYIDGRCGASNILSNMTNISNYTLDSKKLISDFKQYE